MGALFVFFLTGSTELVMTTEVSVPLATVLRRLNNGVQIQEYPLMNLL